MLRRVRRLTGICDQELHPWQLAYGRAWYKVLSGSDPNGALEPSGATCPICALQSESSAPVPARSAERETDQNRFHFDNADRRPTPSARPHEARSEEHTLNSSP